MKIHFYAMLRQIVGGKTVELRVPSGITVQELINEMITHYPRLRAELLDEDGNLYRHVHLFVDGRDAEYLDHGLNTRVAEGNTVSIFPAVGGGAEPA